MFSVVSVCHSVDPGGPHVPITNDALNYNIRGPLLHPPPRHGTLLYGDHYSSPLDMVPHCMGTPLPQQLPLDMGPHVWGPLALLVKSGSQDWRPVQTCSLEDPPTPY